MFNTEHLVLEIIFDYGGEATVFQIAREAGLSTDYTRMICESLGRRDYIDYWAGRGICILRERGAEIGKKAAAERKKLQKTMPRRFSSGFSKDSRGRLIMGY